MFKLDASSDPRKVCNSVRYAVVENGKLCKFPEHKVDPSWNNAIFDTFDEANEYAQKWLGQFAGVILELDKPCDYSGYGDMISIQQT